MKFLTEGTADINTPIQANESKYFVDYLHYYMAEVITTYILIIPSLDRLRMDCGDNRRPSEGSRAKFAPYHLFLASPIGDSGI